MADEPNWAMDEVRARFTGDVAFALEVRAFTSGEGKMFLDWLDRVIFNTEVAAAVDGWDEPLPLVPLQEVPDFPVDIFPDWVQQFVKAEAEALQVPVDLPAMLVLAASSALTGGRVKIRARRGWTEPVNLYVEVTAGSGERKSAVFDAVMAAIQRYEQERVEGQRAELSAAKVTKKIQEKRVERTAAAAAKDAHDKAAQQDAIEQQKILDALVVPAAYQLVADDATPEAVANLLAEQGGRIAVLSAEGGVFGIMAGRYSGDKRPNLDVFLKGHSGDQLRVNRIGRVADFVDDPAITMGLTVQPSVLMSLAEASDLSSRGLLARFLYSCPTSRLGHRKSRPTPMDEHVGRTFSDNLHTLAKTVERESFTLALGKDADEALAAFQDALEPRLGEDGDLNHISLWACKLAGQSLRVAAHLHLLGEYAREPVGTVVAKEAMTDAIRLGHYLIAHSIIAHDLMAKADPTLALARRVLRWLLKERPRTFSKRECFAALRGSALRRADDLDDPLGLLQEHRYIRPFEDPEESPKRGRPSTVYDVNPKTYRATQKTQKSPVELKATANGRGPDDELPWLGVDELAMVGAEVAEEDGPWT